MAAGPGVYLDRMRENASMALAVGASVPMVQAHILAVIRKGNRPTAAEHLDAVELAELVDSLNTFRPSGEGDR